MIGMRQILLLLVAACLAAPALAHDSWIGKGGLRNPQGEWCCGEGDCALLDDDAVHFHSAAMR
jgi:hypothetical protein